VIKAAKAKSTKARGEAKLAPELEFGGALAVLDGVVDAVLEADPVVDVLPVREADELEDVIVEFETPVADTEEEDPVVVDDPDAEAEAEPEAEPEAAGPPVISNMTLKLGTGVESLIWMA